MKRHQLVLAIVLMAMSTIGCGPKHPAQIELTSNDFDLNPLVGEWGGNYSSTETGRSGTIAFTLRAGESAASGNVVMLPRGADTSAAAMSAAAARQVLTIHFVRKEGGNLVGTLDPYRDPECGCQVTTTFQGSFRDARTIEGTYTTVPSKPGTSITTGQWRMTRVKRL